MKLGLIGCGGIAQRAHLPAVRALKKEFDEIVIQAIADPDKNHRNTMGNIAAVSREHRYESLERMLERESIDLAIIATPHHLHARQTKTLARAQVDIICEKPMATTLEEADDLLDTARKNGIRFSVVHNFLFEPATRMALDILRRRDESRPFAGRAQSLFCKNDSALSHNIWRNQKAGGGGCLRDTAYHEIYAIVAMMGSPVASVDSRLSNLVGRGDVENHIHLILEHENGAYSTLTTSWVIPLRETTVFWEVHSHKRSLQVTKRGEQLFNYDRRSRQWREITSPAKGSKNPSSHHYAFFRATLKAYLKGKAFPVFPKEARHIIAIIDAAARSSELKKAVPLR